MLFHRNISLPLAALLSCLLLVTSCRKNANTDVTKEERATLSETIKEYDNLGKKCRDDSQFEKAIGYHKKGLDIAKKLKDTINIVKALNQLGTNFRRLGILDEAAEYHQRALYMATAFSDDTSFVARKNRVTSLNGLGNVYLSLNNYQAADSLFRLALAGETSLGSALGQAINYANLGHILEVNGMRDSAWAYYRLSFEKNKEAKSDIGMALCHRHFGKLYEQEGQMENAQEEYATSLDIMKKTGDKWHWLESCIELASFNVRKGDLASAKSYLDQAYGVAKIINSREHLAEIHKQYYQMYAGQGNYRQALDHFKLSQQLEDSLLDISKINHIQDMRISMERDRQKHELDILRENYEIGQTTKRLVNAMLITLMLLALVIIAFMWYVLRNRSRKVQTLQQMETTKENFFTNITHEFRTPLTVILGLGDQIQQRKASEIEEIHSSAKMIVRQGGSLLQLINQLLDISKVRSAVGTPDWRTGDIITYIYMLIENYQQYAQSKRIELSYTHHEQSIEMDFVPDYINKIIGNLVTNAIQHTDQYGKVNVTVESVGNELHIKVFDTGCGIAPEAQQHIFEPFYQASDDSSNIGTGIGLSLVKMVTDAMNGRVSVESQVGKGSTFYISMPLRHGSQVWQPVSNVNALSIPIHDETALSDNQLQKDGQMPVLLIVEDNAEVASYIGSTLRDRYRIVYAKDGSEGLDKAKDIMPDLIITDVMMPVMDGNQFCREVRASDILNHIPIIVITAKNTERAHIESLEAGADAYLIKPFNTEELNIRVQKLLEQRRVLRTKYASPLNDEADGYAKLNNHDRDFLNRFVDVVNAQISQNRQDVETIASMLNMSRSQLNRKMLAVTGCNTTTYISQLRISKAKRLLDSEPSMSIGDIAMKCGFEDMAYFSRTFKQMTKMTPSQYRKRVR